MIEGRKILLIISGGIAAYKSLEMIRLMRKKGAEVQCILTRGGSEFITPLSVAALSEQPVYTDLFSLKDETEMGHIRLVREADLIVVAPASANMIAKYANGLADDLASTCLLAADAPVLICPAMNHMMWTADATQENVSKLASRGVIQCGPAHGDMACGETGPGRMSEPEDILKFIENHFSMNLPLAGRSAVVTAGPTYEPIDPVRFIGNRSSGKQGFEIARALAHAGASVTLVTGPNSLKSIPYIKTVRIETAEEMLKQAADTLPCDIAVCAAAVSDWRTKSPHDQKIKKGKNDPPSLELIRNPDILETISKHSKRPGLVIGFAAETENVIDNAKTKLALKGCDWIIANDVSGSAVFGQDQNEVTLITKNGTEHWPMQSKESVARTLTKAIIKHFSNPKQALQAAE